MLASRLLPPQLILSVWTLGRQCHRRWLHDPKGSWARWEGDRTPKPQEPRKAECKHEESKHHESEHRDFMSQEPRQSEVTHQERKNQRSRRKGAKQQEPQRQGPKHEELSLFEELFPEEAKKSLKLDHEIDNKEQYIPRLPLPDLDQVEEQDDYDGGQARPRDLTKAASRAAFRQWNLAILVLQRASKSLNDSDFRRIAPKGQHIEDWKGPGDPLRGMISTNIYTTQSNH